MEKEEETPKPLPPAEYKLVEQNEGEIVKDKHGCIMRAFIKGQWIYFGCMLEP